MINKRTRATLRPMLKIRRDSTVSELDERLKEAKLANKKFRKQLLQKDSELQVSLSDHQTFKRYCSKRYLAGALTNFLRTIYVTQSVAKNHVGGRVCAFANGDFSLLDARRRTARILKRSDEPRWEKSRQGPIFTRES